MEDSPVPLVGAQGTSMSSPHGAGFLGLIKYYYEKSPSYGRNGYYSAAVREYIEFNSQFPKTKKVKFKLHFTYPLRQKEDPVPMGTIKILFAEEETRVVRRIRPPSPSPPPSPPPRTCALL